MKQTRAFIHTETRKPIQDAIIYASCGPMWNIYSITAGIVEEIQIMTGAEGNQVVPFCEKLAAMRGGVPVIGKNFILVQVPAPRVCIGCGRELLGAECPWELVSGRRHSGKVRK